MKNPNYYVEMFKVAFKSPLYKYVVFSGSHSILESDTFYSNKAQCRNIGKKFADAMKIEWRE